MVKNFILLASKNKISHTIMYVESCGIIAKARNDKTV